jgi:hypothetical protein
MHSKERTVNEPRTKSSLSPQRKTLIEMMQRLNFGRLENLRIEDGEPIVDAAVRIVQEIKIGGANGPRPELQQSDFVLRAEAIELFDHLDQLGSARIALLQVRAGLPCRIVIEQEDFGANRQTTSGGSKA